MSDQKAKKPPVIKVNENFSFYRGSHDFILLERTENVVKGELKIGSKQTFHPNITAIAKAIINRSAGNCPDMDSLKILLNNAVEVLADEMTVVYEEVEA